MFVRAVETALGRKVPHVVAPLIEIVPLAPDLPPAAGLVLTSRHGAEAAARLGLAAGMPAWCVGEATARAARRAGFAATALGGTADALVAALVQARPDGPLLHLHGAHTRGDVAERLRLAGIATEARPAYEQAERPPSPEAAELLSGPGEVIAPVFSPRSAKLLVAALPDGSSPVVIAISAAAADAADRPGLRILTAERPDLAAMVDITARQLVMSR